MQDYEIICENWECCEEDGIVEMTRNATQLLIDRGATIEQVTLKILLAYEFTGFYYEYDPNQKIKIYEVQYTYRARGVCYEERGVNVWWQNAIKNGVNEGLRRMDKIDAQIKATNEGSHGNF